MATGSQKIPQWVLDRWAELASEGHFTPYQLGDGWKYVRRDYHQLGPSVFQIAEDSTTCTLLALADLCRDRQVDIRPLYRKAYPDEEPLTLTALSAWEIEFDGLVILPRDWQTRDIQKLVEDLGEVDYHSLAEVVSERFLP